MYVFFLFFSYKYPLRSLLLVTTVHVSTKQRTTVEDNLVLGIFPLLNMTYCTHALMSYAVLTIIHPPLEILQLTLNRNEQPTSWAMLPVSHVWQQLGRRVISKVIIKYGKDWNSPLSSHTYTSFCLPLIPSTTPMKSLEKPTTHHGTCFCSETVLGKSPQSQTPLWWAGKFLCWCNTAFSPEGQTYSKQLQMKTALDTVKHFCTSCTFIHSSKGSFNLFNLLYACPHSLVLHSTPLNKESTLDSSSTDAHFYEISDKIKSTQKA